MCVLCVYYKSLLCMYIMCDSICVRMLSVVRELEYMIIIMLSKYNIYHEPSQSCLPRADIT